MSKTLQVPVNMPLTLPDNWQDCVTAQELAYWIIAAFEEFKAGQATKDEITEVANAVTALEKVVNGVAESCTTNTTAIENINAAVTSLNGRVTTISDDVTQLHTEIANMPVWAENSGNTVAKSAMFQTVTAANSKVTVADSLFTTTGNTIFVKVKGLADDYAQGKIFEKSGASIAYDSNMREIDCVSVSQEPVYLIRAYSKNNTKWLNVSLMSAFV